MTRRARSDRKRRGRRVQGPHCIDAVSQECLEHGVTFDRLIALDDMPISRHLEWLESTGTLESCRRLLVDSFNPAAVAGLLCRNTLSFSWDGSLHGCDFSQMCDLPDLSAGGTPLHLRDLEPDVLAAREIVAPAPFRLHGR